MKIKQVGTPSFDVRAALFGVLGVELTQIHGLGPSLSLKLVGECGTDLRAWPSVKHFTSWLYLAPGNKISGERCCCHEQGVHPAARQHFCDWPLSQSAPVIPHLVPSIAASRRG